VAFETPGEKMAATRLHLPSPVRHPAIHAFFAPKLTPDHSPQRTTLHTSTTPATCVPLTTRRSSILTAIFNPAHPDGNVHRGHLGLRHRRVRPRVQVRAAPLLIPCSSDFVETLDAILGSASCTTPSPSAGGPLIRGSMAYSSSSTSC
jgi:hypothetical protein